MILRRLPPTILFACIEIAPQTLPEPTPIRIHKTKNKLNQLCIYRKRKTLLHFFLPASFVWFLFRPINNKHYGWKRWKLLFVRLLVPRVHHKAPDLYSRNSSLLFVFLLFFSFLFLLAGVQKQWCYKNCTPTANWTPWWGRSPLWHLTGTQ